MDKIFRKNKQNLIKHNYLSIQTNYVICIDITQLREQGFVFCALDLAARNIVGHCFNDKPFITSNIIETLKQIIEEPSFLPNIQIRPSDKESLFKNIDYSQFLEHNIIKIGSAQVHSNRVIKRCFSTLKNLIRRFLEPSWKEAQTDPLKQKPFYSNRVSIVVKEAFENYNNMPHKSL